MSDCLVCVGPVVPQDPTVPRAEVAGKDVASVAVPLLTVAGPPFLWAWSEVEQELRQAGHLQPDHSLLLTFYAKGFN